VRARRYRHGTEAPLSDIDLKASPPAVIATVTLSVKIMSG